MQRGMDRTGTTATNVRPVPLLRTQQDAPSERPPLIWTALTLSRPFGTESQSSSPASATRYDSNLQASLEIFDAQLRGWVAEQDVVACVVAGNCQDSACGRT